MKEWLEQISINDIITIITGIAVPAIGYFLNREKNNEMPGDFLYISEKSKKLLKRYSYLSKVCWVLSIACIESYFFLFLGTRIPLSRVFYRLLIAIVAIVLYSFIYEFLDRHFYLYSYNDYMSFSIFLTCLVVFIHSPISPALILGKKIFSKYQPNQIKDLDIMIWFLCIAGVFIIWAKGFSKISKYIRKGSVYKVKKANIWTKTHNIMYENVYNIIEQKESISFNCYMERDKHIVIPKSELSRIEYDIISIQISSGTKKRSNKKSQTK